jgi:hypothetical protein
MQRAKPVVQEQTQSIVEAAGISRKTVEMTQVGWVKTAILKQSHSNRSAGSGKR